MPNYIKKYGKRYFCTETNTIFNQIVISFTYGLLFGSLSWGIIWFLIYVIIYELIIFYITKSSPSEWKCIDRIIINIFMISGWILGRWIVLGRTYSQLFT